MGGGAAIIPAVLCWVARVLPSWLDAWPLLTSRKSRLPFGPQRNILGHLAEKVQFLAMSGIGL
jgi:hypothetical protein